MTEPSLQRLVMLATQPRPSSAAARTRMSSLSGIGMAESMDSIMPSGNPDTSRVIALFRRVHPRPGPAMPAPPRRGTRRRPGGTWRAGRGARSGRHRAPRRSGPGRCAPPPAGAPSASPAAPGAGSAREARRTALLPRAVAEVQAAPDAPEGVAPDGWVPVRAHRRPDGAQDLDRAQEHVRKRRRRSLLLTAQKRPHLVTRSCVTWRAVPERIKVARSRALPAVADVR